MDRLRVAKKLLAGDFRKVCYYTKNRERHSARRTNHLHSPIRRPKSTPRRYVPECFTHSSSVPKLQPKAQVINPGPRSKRVDSLRPPAEKCNSGRSSPQIKMCVLSTALAKRRPQSPNYSLRLRLITYYGYCGIPWHSDREAVSSTLVDVVTLASGYPGTRECFHGMKNTKRYYNTRCLMAKHRHR